jgi:hypothetical protein
VTTSLTPEDLIALGLPPDAELHRAGEAVRPDDGAGHGLASAPAKPDDLSAVFHSVTPIDFFHDLAVRIGAPEAGLARSDRGGGMYLLARSGLALTATADLRPLDDERVAVDASVHPMKVRIHGALGDGVLCFDRESVVGYEFIRHASAEMRGLAEWTPVLAPTFSAPDPDELLGGFDAPSWLTDPLRAVPPRGAYGVCAAVGTLGRLWSPRGTTTPASAAMARLRADDHPWARARRWFDALPAAHRAVVEQLARVECDVLTDALDALLDDDLGPDPDEAVAWLERRDDLSSVAALLRTVPNDPLGVALATLDREAGVRASAWRRLAPLSSHRLEAVAWQSPEAWWGALAEPT